MKGKRKSLLSRILSGALSFIVALTTLGSFGVELSASASSLKLEQIHGDFWYYWNVADNAPNGTKLSAFCVELGTYLNNGTNYTSSTTYYSDTMKKAMGDTIRYGYPVVSTSEAYFCATQAIVWEFADGLRDVDTLKLKKSGTSYYNKLTSTSEQDAYKAIAAKLEKHKAKPTYNGKTITLKYNLSTNLYEGTITDKTGYSTDIISKINAATGYTATKSGNNIKVTVKPANISTTGKKFTGEKTGFPDISGYQNNVVFIMDNNAQKLMSGVYPDPVAVNVTLKGEVDSGNFNVYKKYYDANANLITTGLSTLRDDTYFRLSTNLSDGSTMYVRFTKDSTGNYTYYALTATASTKKPDGDETGQLITGEVDNDKHRTVASLKGLPEGTYTLTEVQYPSGYIPSDPITIEVVADKTKSATVSNDEELHDTGVRLRKMFKTLDNKSYYASEYRDLLYTTDDGKTKLALAGMDISQSGATSYVNQILGSVYFIAYFKKGGTNYYITSNSLKSGNKTTGEYVMDTAQGDTEYKGLTTTKSQAYAFEMGTVANGGAIHIDKLTDNSLNGGYGNKIYFEERYYNTGKTGYPYAKAFLWGSYETANSFQDPNVKECDYISKTNYIVKNYERYLKVSYIKKDYDSLDEIDGAVYGLYVYDDESKTTANEVDRKTSKGSAVTFSGQIDLYKAIRGLYFIKEIKAPDGYETDESRHKVVVTINGTEITSLSLLMENIRALATANGDITKAITLGNVGTSEQTVTDKARGSISLKKLGEVGDKSEAELENISFTLTAIDIYENGVQRHGVDIGTYKTDSKGELTIDDLPMGRYVIYETSRKFPFVANTQSALITLTVEEPDADVTIVNNLQRIDLSVLKVENGTNYPLEGAQFIITAEEDFYIPNHEGEEKYKVHSKGDTIGTLTTGADGKASNITRSDSTLSVIESEIPLYTGATYRITEVKAPKGYTISGNFTRTFTVDNTEYNQHFSATYISKEITFINNTKTGSISVKKVDKDNNDIPLQGAVFELYAAEDVYNADGSIYTINIAGGIGKIELAKGTKIATATTDADGKAEFFYMYQGNKIYFRVPVGYTYTVKEVKAPKNYRLADPAEQTFELEDNNLSMTNIEVEKSFYDEEIKGSIAISKRDNDTKVGLSGAHFKVTAAEDIFFSDGSLRTAKGTVVVADLVTDKNGKASYKNLPFGKYEVEETQAPENFKLDTKSQTVELTFDDPETLSEEELEKTLTFYDDWITYPVAVVKVDDDGTTYPLSGAKFSLVAGEDIKKADGSVLYAKDKVIETVTTGADGKAEFKPVPMSWNYTIREDSAPNGYVNEGKTKDIKVVDSQSYTFENTPQPVKITVYKQDGDTKVGLSGAKFRIVADETIYRSNGNVWANKGDVVVSSITTDDKGTAIAETADLDTIKGEKLRIGKYKVEEIAPPTLFTLNKVAQYVTAEYDATAKIVEQSLTFNNDRQLGEISVFKQDGDTKVGLAEAVFSLKANEDVLKADGSVLYAKGSEIERITTGADGKATFKRVPTQYTYTVTEEAAPKNFVNKHEQKTFTLLYDAALEFVSASDTFSNDWQLGEISVFKQDGDTKVGLAGAEFTLTVGDKDVAKADGTVYTVTKADGTKVELKAGTVIDKITTGADGKATFPNKVPVGYSYTVTETKAPTNYVNTHEAKTFDLAYNAELEFVTVSNEFANKYQLGEISVFKMEKNTKKGLAGAEFTLTVGDKDVVKADGTVYTVTKADGTKVELKAGTVIDKITTGADGKAIFPNRVPVGYSYTVAETKAPKNFVNAHESTTFDLAYNAEIEFVAISKEFYNEYQTGTVKVIKKDAETNTGLAGAVFELRAAEDIANEYLGVNWKKNTAIESVTTDKDGNAEFKTKLPVDNRYIVVETKAPDGYVNANEQQEFNINYNEAVEFVSTTQNFKNTPITVEISKRNAEGEELKDAHLQLTDKDGNVIDEWISDGTNHVVKRLKAGDYTLKETAAPVGYTIATDIKFNVSDKNVVAVNGIEVTTKSSDNIPLIVMVDNATKVAISKRDAGGSELKGASLQLLNDKNEVVTSWVSDGTDHVVTNLPVGKYTLHETAAPNGYCIATDIAFTIDVYNKVTVGDTVVTATSSDDIPLVVMVDKATKVKLYKLDDEGNNLAGAKLKIVDDKGKVVKEWTSEAEPIVLTAELTAGLTYSYEEIESKKGYCLAGKVSFTVSTNGELDEVKMTDMPTIVEISKVSLTGEEEIEGAVMQLYDDEGNLVAEWTSTKVPYVLKAQLEAGKKYTLHEKTPPIGWVLAEDIDFTVSTDGSKDVVVMKDDDTKVHITKYDLTTGKELEGAKLQVLDDGGNVIDEWTSGGSAHVIRGKLKAGGKYTLHEEQSADGYTLAEDVEFTVSEDGKIDKVDMYDDVNRGDIVIQKKTEGNINIEGIELSLKGVSDTGLSIERTVTTDANGKATFKLIPVGTYVISEVATSVNTAYLVADDKDVTVSYAETSNVEIYNAEKTGIVEVQKRTEGDLNLEGIDFILTGTSDSGRAIELTATTGADGKATFENVPIGTYTISEDGETTPTAYLVAEPTEVTVTYAETTTIEIANVEKTGTIEIDKSTKGDKNIKGIEFILEGTSDSGREIKMTAKTDKNGKATFENVPVGTYTITENGKTVPKAYLTAEPTEVTVIFAETSTVKITNVEKTGTIEVNKSTEVNKNINGIEFILEGTSDSGREIKMTAKTDKDGKATFENVPVGTYTITENGKTVPKAYLVAEPTEVTVKYSKTTTVKVYNAEKTGTIKVQKKTEDMKDVSGIEFILEGTSDSGRTIKMTATTDKNGKATFENVPVGTYTITENGETVPTGYLVADEQEVTVKYSEQTDVTFINKPEEHKKVTTTVVTGNPKTDNESGTGTLAFMGMLLPIFAVFMAKKTKKEEN